ncbi:hypothetical protein WH47_01702 [Habropoda laboriosa]|uniref:Histone-lysine N-methyltransferase SETMAR n=1 Tax=Habropoda laboriosa TaxID=597456 RepID=A0A0L7QJW1_9HYME|nr:hypothetical protein WH47_01702 [Habropoda laboriosa]
MYKTLRVQQPTLVNRRGVLLLHNNARPHIAKQTVSQTPTTLGRWYRDGRSALMSMEIISINGI